jgi:hypothetical protein
MLRGPQCCTLQTNDNQRAGGQGRAGTAGGRQGNVSYDVFFWENCKGGGG